MSSHFRRMLLRSPSRNSCGMFSHRQTKSAMPRELVPNPNDERVYRVRIIRSGTHVSGMKCYRCLRNRLRRSVMSRNARPEPVLRYCSNAAALSAFANVVNATSVQGRRCAVCFEPPLLCTAKRLPLVEAHATEDAKQAASRTRPICTKVKIEYARTSALAVDGCGKE